MRRARSQFRRPLSTQSKAAEKGPRDLCATGFPGLKPNVAKELLLRARIPFQPHEDIPRVPPLDTPTLVPAVHVPLHSLLNRFVREQSDTGRSYGNTSLIPKQLRPTLKDTFGIMENMNFEPSNPLIGLYCTTQGT